MQQRRNTEETSARASGIPYQSLRKHELRRQLVQAKTSNASNGVHDTLVDGVKLKSSKQKFESVLKSVDVERKQGMDILSKLEKGKGPVRVSKRGVHALGRDAKKAVGRDERKKMAPKSGKKKRKM